jgi:hypothetical protein
LVSLTTSKLACGLAESISFLPLQLIVGGASTSSRPAIVGFLRLDSAVPPGPVWQFPHFDANSGRASHGNPAGAALLAAGAAVLATGAAVVAAGPAVVATGAVVATEVLGDGCTVPSVSSGPAQLMAAPAAMETRRPRTIDEEVIFIGSVRDRAPRPK